MGRIGAISPDGKYLAYTDNAGIHVKVIETGETQTVLQPEVFKGKKTDWEVVNWFPDGTRFLAQVTPPPERYSVRQHPSIWTVSLLGGAPRKLREEVNAESISPDGSLIAFTTNWHLSGPIEVWLMGRMETKRENSLTMADMEGLPWCVGHRMDSEWLTSGPTPKRLRLAT
jgi:Tol biopolymer transport system component